ncbi:hypothetical protein [Sphingomonas nostoxanthinifaciens]|uniref:hypothetical protein n=1 Tax=Sphingomonas nostoxanthinifaciens TaxID=2872652 RepID=UPI001CC2176C|nr:hypothetical protein [Sphingomonas nostoxanthinifaciens]UAK26176.1 hypothetical protein K8P63_08790 [Sphingomonas nostoxanthinifaciens]
MSLFSLLNSSTATTSQSLSYSGSSATTSAAIQKLLAAESASTASATPATTTTSSSDVSISSAAQEAADNAKDFTQLGKDTRATLDAQYAAAGTTDTSTATPNLTGLSGRALAAIALNQDKTFSSTEVHAAKQALQQDMRTSLTGAIGSSGVTLTGLATYSQQLVSEYDSMSPEERQARGWTDSFRASNQSFINQASQSTLFDQIS